MRIELKRGIGIKPKEVQVTLLPALFFRFNKMLTRDQITVILSWLVWNFAIEVSWEFLTIKKSNP